MSASIFAETLVIDQSGGRQSRQFSGAIRRQLQVIEEPPNPQLGVLRPHGGDVLAAHGDEAVIKAGRTRHGHQGHQFAAAARLTKDGDLGGVAAEAGDVVAHPA